MTGRIVGIWASGLFAGAIFGALIGDALSKSEPAGFFGLLAGGCAFTCFRLWVGDPPLKRDLPIFDLSRSDDSAEG